MTIAINNNIINYLLIIITNYFIFKILLNKKLFIKKSIIISVVAVGLLYIIKSHIITILLPSITVYTYNKYSKYYIIPISYFLISNILLIQYPYINNINILITYTLLIIIIYITKKKNKVNTTLTSTKSLVLFTLITYINTLIFYTIKENYPNKIEYILLMTIILIITILNNKTSQKQNKIFTELYNESKENDTRITHYRMYLHENNNRLLTIKSMLKDNEKAIRKYIDTAIEQSKKSSKITYPMLDKIPILGIKMFIGNKLNILKRNGTKIELYVSDDIKNLKCKLRNISLNNLFNILGVILDNMIEAQKSVQNKYVSIHIYSEDNNLNMEFANTFNQDNKKNLLLPRHTSKKLGHGIGICLIKEIIKNNDCYKLNTKIIDNYFVEHLTINIDELLKTTK